MERDVALQVSQIKEVVKLMEMLLKPGGTAVIFLDLASVPDWRAAVSARSELYLDEMMHVSSKLGFACLFFDCICYMIDYLQRPVEEGVYAAHEIVELCAVCSRASSAGRYEGFGRTV